MGVKERKTQGKMGGFGDCDWGKLNKRLSGMLEITKVAA